MSMLIVGVVAAVGLGGVALERWAAGRLHRRAEQRRRGLIPTRDGR